MDFLYDVQGFQEMGANVCRFLESHSFLQDVSLDERAAAEAADLAAWEAAHHPLVLPADLKAFYMVSDGLLLRWDVACGEEAMPLGSMQLNSIAQLQPLPASSLLNEAGANAPELPVLPGNKRTLRAFDLDATCTCGRVCLLYCDGVDNSKAQARARAAWRASAALLRRARSFPPAARQVWFQDLACGWAFIANSFTDYFRSAAPQRRVPPVLRSTCHPSSAPGSR